jgi:hypothetical protein
MLTFRSYGTVALHAINHRYLYLGTEVSFRFDGGGSWPSANWDVCLAGMETMPSNPS